MDAASASPSSCLLMVETAVQETMAAYDASHDFAHVNRVKVLALRIAARENVTAPDSLECIAMASLLHDVDDHKYGGNEDGSVATRIMLLANVQDQMRDRVNRIIAQVGFSSNALQSTVRDGGLVPNIGLYSATASSGDLEAKIVQDADRLDAIGAIGVARCFTYGGAKGRVLHDPRVAPRVELTKEAYREGTSTTINHFCEYCLRLTCKRKPLDRSPHYILVSKLADEKLLTLSSLMHTQSGRDLASRRHAFMVSFLEQFLGEWDGIM